MRLSERIEQLEERLRDALGAIEERRSCGGVVPGPLLEVYATMSGDLDWLRELRQRRIAMGRDPDDERNATADLQRCDGEPPSDQCAYLGGECQPPSCAVAKGAAADLERQMVESLTPPPDHEALARQVLAAGPEVAQRVAVMLLAELGGDGAVNTYKQLRD